MVPHVLGYFPITAAWVVIVAHLEFARHDLSQISDRTIPDWVDALLYGTILIVRRRLPFGLISRSLSHVSSCLLAQFWSFAVVQLVFQALPPGERTRRTTVPFASI